MSKDFNINVEVPMAATLKVTLTPLGISVKLVDVAGGETDDFGSTFDNARSLSQQVANARETLSPIVPPSTLAQFDAALAAQIVAAT